MPEDLTAGQKAARTGRRRAREHGWRLAFFEGPTGAPRAGIIDAIAFRLRRANADALEVRLVQVGAEKLA